MHTFYLRVLTPFVICVNLPLCWAAANPIGVVVTGAHFKLNGAEATGNATIFDGGSVQSGRSGASIRLNNGGSVTLGPNSRGAFSIDHLLLEEGAVRVAGYSVRARDLNIDVGQSSSATISLRGEVVKVAASTGNVHVFNASGMNVANLSPGDALDLHSQDPKSSDLSALTGCVTKSGKSYLLTDVTSKVTVVLKGGNVVQGESVHVRGRIVSEPHSSTDSFKSLKVVDVRILPGVCSSRPPSAASAAREANASDGNTPNTDAAAAGSSDSSAGATGSGAAQAGVGGAGSAVSGTVIAGVAVAAGVATAVGLAVVSSPATLSNGR